MFGLEFMGSLPEIALGVFEIYLLAAGPVLLLGVPVIMASVKLPSKLGIQDIKEEELSEGQRLAFDEIDALMAPQGFHPARTFTATELPNRNILRVYLSSADPAVPIAAAITTVNDNSIISDQYFELETRFADGTVVQTKNTTHQEAFAKLPHVELHDHPEMSNPLTLKPKHDEYCSAHRAKGARFYSADELIDLIEEDNLQQMDYQLKRGRLARTKAGQFRLTFSNAVRQVLGFVNPFKDPRVSYKVASVLLLIGLPIAAVAAISTTEVGLLHAIGSQVPSVTREMAVFIAMLPLVAAGSVAIAGVFGSHSVIWAVFVPLVESRMLLPHGVAGFGGHFPILIMLVGAVQISLVTSNYLSRRRDITR